MEELGLFRGDTGELEASEDEGEASGSWRDEVERSTTKVAISTHLSLTYDIGDRIVIVTMVPDSFSLCLRVG